MVGIIVINNEESQAKNGEYPAYRGYYPENTDNESLWLLKLAKDWNGQQFWITWVGNGFQC